jgi:hypothetical protein
MDIKKLNDIMNQSRLKKKEAGLNLKTLRLKQQTYEAGVVSGHQHYLSKTGLFSRSEEKVKKDGVFSKIMEIVEPELYRAWQKFQEKNL